MVHTLCWFFSSPLTLYSGSLSRLPTFPRYRLSAPLCPASNSSLLAPSSARAPRASLVAGAAPRCPASYSTLLAPSSARAPRASLIAGAAPRCPGSYSTLLAPSSARAPRASLIAGAIDDALKAVQAERIVETIISSRSAQRTGCVGGKVRWKD